MGSYQEVTAIYCGLTGSMVGCFQSWDMLSLQVESGWALAFLYARGYCPVQLDPVPRD